MDIVYIEPTTEGYIGRIEELNHTVVGSTPEIVFSRIIDRLREHGSTQTIEAIDEEVVQLQGRIDDLGRRRDELLTNTKEVIAARLLNEEMQTKYISALSPLTKDIWVEKIWGQDVVRVGYRARGDDLTWSWHFGKVMT